MKTFDVKSWEVARKDVYKNLTFDAGRITGDLKDEGDMTVQPLYGWTIKLVKRQLEFKLPMLSKVSVNLPSPLSVPEPALMDATSVVMYLPDQHFGYKGNEPTHCAEFLESCYRIAKHLRPDYIVWGGDLLDLASFSSFINDPAYLSNTQRALNEAAAWLGLYATLGMKQFMLKGNHEQRIDRSLMKLLPEAYSLHVAGDKSKTPLLSLENLLSLDELGIQYIDDYPDGEIVIDGVRYMHGNIARKGSGKTVSAIIQEATMSTVFGHIHRRESAEKTIADSGRHVWVATPGWMGNNSVPGGRVNSNWQLGALVVSHGQFPEFITADYDGRATFRNTSF